MITYKDAGVDIDKGEKFVETVKRLAQNLPKEHIISSIGGFSAMFSLENFGADLVLSSTTDGVGTKLLIAQMANKHDTVGIDLVAMNVNDIITNGTMPVFFLDYISYSDVNDEVLNAIISGIAEGLKESKATLVGGETAQMPDMYKKGEYDLAGFCVGIARKDELIQTVIEQGDVVVGISSNGFHSNGYSLLRKLFFDVAGYKLDTHIEGETLCELLLKPTNIYVNVFSQIKQFIKAAAHITGGGFYGNIPRILGDKFDVIIEKQTLPEINIFKLVQDIGGLSEKEMYRTFNMGVGFVIIVDDKDKIRIMKKIKDAGFTAYLMGYVQNGEGRVEIV